MGARLGSRSWVVFGHPGALAVIMMWLLFFFSSRRRHTRFDCDWSSDVCSSDLPSCRCLGKNRGIYDDAVIGARHFLDHLRDTGVAPAGAPLEKPPLPTLIDGFERWMQQHRGVSESTLTTYRLILTKLLGAVGEDRKSVV